MQNRVRLYRERRHINQAELARLTGVSRQALSAIESHKQEPSLGLALKIAHLLKMPVENLFYGEEKKMGKTLLRQSLTEIERLILVNQYKILQAIHANDEDLAKEYHNLEKIFERGYVSLYYEAMDNLWDELSTEISEEVISIMDMHRTMLWSLGENPDPDDVKKVRFLGFDANNEAEHLGFAKFYTQGGERYAELRVANSHHPTLGRYQKMMARWNELGRNPQLSKDEIESIVEAGTYRHE